MNPRIKELAGKALDDAVPQTWTTLTAQDLDRFTEKFAELIVQECVKVCLEERDPSNLNYKPSVKFAEAIKYHFGV